MITILVNGANGRMGTEAVQLVENTPDFHLVASGTEEHDLSQLIKEHRPDIVIDFTTAQVAYHNAKIIIEHNTRPVIGTSGFLPEQISELTQLCATKKLGGVIAPNFSIAVVLLQRCAQQIAAYLPHVEIIEMHHDGKLDAPSATAIKTAELLATVREKTPIKSCHETIAHARGALCHDIPIHAIRLPGVVAHLQTIFGNTGETLRLQHDSINRESFMPGVALACRKVMELNQLIYGLETLIGH